MTSQYRVTTKRPLPKGVKVSKGGPKTIEAKKSDKYPIARMKPGASFYVESMTARDLRNAIHRPYRTRTQGAKFISRTERTYDDYGYLDTYGAVVFRVK